MVPLTRLFFQAVLPVEAYWSGVLEGWKLNRGKRARSNGGKMYKNVTFYPFGEFPE